MLEQTAGGTLERDIFQGAAKARVSEVCKVQAHRDECDAVDVVNKQIIIGNRFAGVWVAFVERSRQQNKTMATAIGKMLSQWRGTQDLWPNAEKRW